MSAMLTIQAWLGQAKVATTHRYAAADIEMMRKGLEKAGVRRSWRPFQRSNQTMPCYNLLKSI
ncbi:hypothetical protein GOA53_29380 [Sinorhizobium meliloti]|nr:hypothetical protein [Sinorhizobium meliloti]MQV77962.1 hypothetical protein [Sinorhizobium meliloti]